MKFVIRLLVFSALAHALAACGAGAFPNQLGPYGYRANLPQNQPFRGRFGSPMAGPAGAVAAGMMGMNGRSGGFILAPPEAGEPMYSRTSYDSNFHQPPTPTFLVSGGGGTVGGTPPQNGQVIAPSEPAASQADIERLRAAGQALLREQDAINARLRNLEQRRATGRRR